MNAIAELAIKTPNFEDDFDNNSLSKQIDEQKSIQNSLNENNCDDLGREHISTILRTCT